MIEILLTLTLISYNPVQIGKLLIGKHEWDKPGYKNPYPVSKNPVLKLSTSIIDEYDNIISPGIYQIQLSRDNSRLLFTQGFNILGSIKVSKLIKSPKKSAINSASLFDFITE